MQSAPDVSGKIVFSASIDKFRISSEDNSLNNSDIDAAAATQQAEDDPRSYSNWNIRIYCNF